MPSTVAVIGAGSVGSSVAHALVMSGTCGDVVLVDIDTERCKGEAMDLNDGALYSDTNVRMGTFGDASKADIIVVTAGVKQRPGETRDELLLRNRDIMTNVCGKIMPVGENTVILLVANPVEVLAALTQKITGLPPSRVFGSGTILDSMRLRVMLGDRLGIAPSAVHAYVVGEHGDAQVALWSSAAVSGVPVSKLPDITEAAMKDMATAARTQAYEIIKRKGSTFYGIAACVVVLCDSILQNRRRVKPVSVFSPEYGTYVSLPAVIGRCGVSRILTPTMSAEEREQVGVAAEKVKKSVRLALGESRL